MVVVVVAVFILCWLPFYVLNVVNLLVVLPGDFRGLYFFVVVLSYANSCANPILYGFLSDNYKRGFRKAVCRTSRRVKNTERAATDAQRPTEEWGGVVLQRLEGAAHLCRKDCGEKDEEEEIIGTNRDMQLSEIQRVLHNGKNRSRTEGCRTPVVQGGQPEPGGSKHGELAKEDPAEAASSLARKDAKSRSQPEASGDENSVLEISSL